MNLSIINFYYNYLFINYIYICLFVINILIFSILFLLIILLDESYSTEWYILSLFCKMLNRQLLTMGDDEFFSEQNSLNINNIVKVSILVRVSTI